MLELITMDFQNYPYHQMQANFYLTEISPPFVTEYLRWEEETAVKISMSRINVSNHCLNHFVKCAENNNKCISQR